MIERIPAEENRVRICSTEYMHEVLRHFDLREIHDWHRELVRIDQLIAKEVELAIQEIIANEGRLTHNLIARLSGKLDTGGIKASYDLKNLEAFHGYRAYGSPDAGKAGAMIKKNCPHTEPYYGIAVADSRGLAHRHQNPAYNLILSGEGVFAGATEDKEKYPYHYHGMHLKAGTELEIPAGMVHGHLVNRNCSEPFSFFFVQECGFRPGMKCQGDFEEIENYNYKQFGSEHI